MLHTDKVIVMGVSAGALTVLEVILPMFPAAYPIPVVVAQHLHPHQENLLMTEYNRHCSLLVKEAQEKEPIQAGTIYFAPPNYHLLINDDRTFALSVDAKVHFSRPAIDVLFESAVDTYGAQVIGVVLTGANQDGAAGLRCIKEAGGITVVQDPETAVSAIMPRAAIAATQVDYILSVPEIGRLLVDMVST